MLAKSYPRRLYILSLTTWELLEWNKVGKNLNNAIHVSISLSLSFCQFRLSKKHLKGESRLPGMETNDAKNWNPIYKNSKRKKKSNLKIALANNKE